jgi:hypothetical protein
MRVARSKKEGNLRGNTDIVHEDYDRTETCELCPLSFLHAVGS